MASLRPPESHGSGPPPRNHSVSFTSFAADDLTLAQSPPPKSPTVSATDQKRYPYCWSKLVPDLLQMVFERLGFADLKRAKSVCSSWQSASRNCQPNNQIPWVIRFPKKSNYCLLFNPEEKDQIYKTQNLGDDFAKSVCVAMYRSWLLMQPRFKYIEDDLQWNLYILDLLTRERINLPSFVSNYGVSSPILWIDEKTKDHLVTGLVDEEYTICFKKGDKSWKQIPSLYECFSMVYKDRKLYCLDHHKLKILDFSQEIPQQVFKISVRGCVPSEIGPCIRLPGIPTTDQMSHLKNDLVVTVSGDVLIVESRRPSMSKIWKFEIYKMDSSKGNKWEKIVSMGDEAILLDLGVTVVAKDMEGIQSNSIYFSNATPYYEDQYDKNEIFIFKLDSKKVEQPHRSVCSSFPCSRARWFLPSFKRE